MPGLASADPHTLSTLSISRTNGQQRSHGLVSPSRNMDQGHTSEQSRVDHCPSTQHKEIPRLDMRAAEESLSLYCKPIELYNIIQRRASRNPIFLQRCLGYKIEEARKKRIKLTISVTKVVTIPSDAKLSVEKQNGNRPSLGIVSEEQAFQSVLVMLTAPVSTGMSRSCFRLSQTRVLRTSSVNLSPPEQKVQTEVTFLLPEIQKLLLNAKRDGAVIVFITSAETSSACNGKGSSIDSSVNSSGAVMWGSISLTTLCQKWSVSGTDGDGDVVKADRVQVDLSPSRLQLVNTMEGRFVNFESTEVAQSKTKLQVSLSVKEAGTGYNKSKSVGGDISNNGNCPSLSQSRRLLPGQVIFHYHYYFNQLYKPEVTENYSCPFCVQCCSSLKGLRCHLNSTHDLFTFEFLATADYRLVNVYCRNDVLDPEGNVRDIDGLNDPRLKNFVYWSRCGRPRRASIVLDLQGGTLQCEGGLEMAQGLVYADVLENAGEGLRRKHERLEDPGKQTKAAEQVLQAYKKQRCEIDDPKPSSPGHRYMGTAPNGVCLAIAAPRPADKRNLQPSVNAPVVPSKPRVEKHRKSMVERSEARIRLQLQKRQFYHSHTAQPMAMEQLLSDRDSEDENDDAIMDLEDRRMLDDFVDVTQDEKELMHLWNSFVRKQRVLADGHCPWACEAFTKLHAKTFHTSTALRRCWVLFLIKLWNHNLVDGNTINRCFLIVDSFSESAEHKADDAKS